MCCFGKGLFRLRGGHTDAKTRADGRPSNQPTNHTIYRSWEGAQVLLLVLCGLPDLPYLGGRSFPTIFSAHLTILSATHPAPLPWHAFGGQTHRHSCFSRAFPSLLTRFQHGTVLVRRTHPRAEDFKACDAIYSHLEVSSRVRSRISQGRFSVTWRLRGEKKPPPGWRRQTTYLPHRCRPALSG